MNSVQTVCLVSDGIVVSFSDGTSCYYPASFLLEQIHASSNQILLNYDPSQTTPVHYPRFVSEDALSC